jgi:peroxiredoxin
MRGTVSRPLLNVLIVASGVLLGVLHYKLKPGPTSTEIRDQAHTMIAYTEWRGQIAPDFELKTNDGATFRLSDNIGQKIIVLNFFATWCGPCRAEMPELNRYFNDHRSDSFLLLAIDSEEQPDRVEDFLRELKLDFPAGIDQGSIQRQYGVTSFPTTVCSSALTAKCSSTKPERWPTPMSLLTTCCKQILTSSG